MSERNFSPMPQNDRHQVVQIKQEYANDPAMGVAHGVQKDAIQNGIGAIITGKSLAKGFKKNWKFNFELLEIKGSLALSFWDEGTTGLTGDILTCNQIDALSQDDGLGADNANERLSRFLSRFNSGGNSGPGSFGRGKLIFQAASESNSILIDSLRSDDGKYIVLSRKLFGNSLKQDDPPAIDENAKQLIKEETGGELLPLEKYGTRITIFDIDAEIAKAFKDSFSKPNSEDSLYHMISETWWEIIEMGAEINLIHNGEVLRVNLTTDLQRIIRSKHDENGFKVHKKENITVTCRGEAFVIKEIKLVLSPDPVPELFNEIWLQRKKMKIGPFKSRRLGINVKISDRLSGYVRLDNGLEAEFESVEHVTHYSFGTKIKVVQEVQRIIRQEVSAFQKKLGFKTENRDGKIRDELNSALTRLNEMAKVLGLPTAMGQGKKESSISLAIKSLVLPNDGTSRVHFGQEIGPIEYQVTNRSKSALIGKLVVTFEQGKFAKEVYSKTEIFIEAGSNEIIKVENLLLEKEGFSNHSMLLIKSRFILKGMDKHCAQVTRNIWLGIDPPVTSEYLCDLKLQNLTLPNNDTKRVELGDIIKNVGFTISNTKNKNFKLNIDVKVRKSKNTDSDVIDLANLLEERSFEIKALSDNKFDLGDFEISNEIFGAVFDEVPKADFRKCEIFYSVRFAEAYEDFEVLKGQHACNKKFQDFYCGVDPAGNSIFKDIDNYSDENDHKRAKTEGSDTEGYTFFINSGHPSYKWVDDKHDAELLIDYVEDQMILHSCKFIVQNDAFEGSQKDLREKLIDDDSSPYEVAESFDELVSMVLKKWRS